MKRLTPAIRHYTTEALAAFLAEIITFAANPETLAQQFTYEDAAIFVAQHTALVVGSDIEADQKAARIRAILIERRTTFDSLAGALEGHESQIAKQRADHYQAILIMLALYR